MAKRRIVIIIIEGAADKTQNPVSQNVIRDFFYFVKDT